MTMRIQGLRIIETDAGLVADDDARVTGEATSDYLLSAQGGSVSYVATDADLPATAAGHPVILVLEDSTSVDFEDNPQATLRYWTGEDWRLLGLAGVGGGTVSSDFIDVPANLAGMSGGKTIVYDGSQFIPGSLS